MTGHRGLIGSFLKRRLEGEGHKIVLAIDKIEDNKVDELEDLKIDDKVDIFIHCAALCKINNIVDDPLKGFGNVEDIQTVFEFCRKNKISKIIYFSSSRVLNKEKNAYTAGKIYGEEMCKAYKDCYGIDYLILRPSTVYGPIRDRTNRLMNIFINNALDNKDLIIFGDPESKTLDFTYVEDFVDGVMLAINGEWNKEYNISGNEEVRVIDLARFIIREAGSESDIVVRDREVAQPQRVKVDISEIEKLGYKPKVNLWRGVRRNVEFLRGVR
tara:strand:- start:496 stop:1308 length:813 start_codon:yes stop_codon:yes gene_type:complete